MRLASTQLILKAALTGFALASTALPAAAQPSLDQDDGEAPSLPEPPSEGRSTADRILDNESRIEQLEAQILQLQERTSKPPRVTFTGYADVGFFVPNGNDGVGWQRDVGFQQFPELADQFAWVFVGDILGTPVNSRGEAASLGDAPAAARFDSVNSSGAPSFIANEINMRTEVMLASSAFLRTSINFVPRTGSDFALGDFFDVDVAEVEWVVIDGTSIFVGKMMPVFGIEYKERWSDQRFGITPSLVQRYTSGPQLGFKVRSKLFNDWLIIAVAGTNGAPTTEQFHFYSEIDTNSGKTINGRIAVNLPIGDLIEAVFGDTLEIGFSGVWGPQDRASNNDGSTWFLGADLTYRSANFAVKAQLIFGNSDGQAEERVWSLDLNNSGYVEVNWLVMPWLGVIVRGDLRNADVALTNERIYITRSWRLTGGLKAVFNQHIQVKAEYLHNGEFGEVRSFDNDIFTSSLVLSY